MLTKGVFFAFLQNHTYHMHQLVDKILTASRGSQKPTAVFSLGARLQGFLTYHPQGLYGKELPQTTRKTYMFKKAVAKEHCRRVSFLATPAR